MLDDDYTKLMMKMVNENSDYSRIGRYIISKFNIDITMQEAKKIGEFLALQKGFSKDDVLNGLADRSIKKIINYNKMKENSIEKNYELKENIPLKTKKVIINKKFVIGVAASFLTISLLYNFALEPAYNDFKEDKKIRQSIGMMVADVNSDDYKYGRGIVAQNTYHAGFNEKGYPNVAYHNDKIAEDIIKVSLEDADIFDLCMYNVYTDISYNKLKNMDEVIRWLNVYTKDNDDLQFIQDKLFNCDVFLDYIMLRGFANPNDKDYTKLVEDIKMYKESDDNVPLYSLSEESQKRIEELIREYKSNRGNLYSEYKSRLEEQGDSYGTRS